MNQQRRTHQLVFIRARVIAKHGVEFFPADLTIYSARHTFATRKLASGVSIQVVAALLGNTVQVCERHYCHLHLVGNLLWQATGITTVAVAG